MKIFKYLFVFTSLMMYNTIASQNSKCLKNIDTQIWSIFTKAYETADYVLYASIHSEDFIRVSGNSKSIRDKTTYINNYKKNWEQQNNEETISFRFLERICNDTKASERGIFKFTLNPNTPQSKSYFGKFHVIHVQRDGKWQILIDYDSNENNTITEVSYNKAFAIGDYEKY